LTNEAFLADVGYVVTRLRPISTLRAALALTLVALGTLAPPLAAHAELPHTTGELATCCCVPELEPAWRATSTEAASCCSSRSDPRGPSPFDAEETLVPRDDADCFCIPLPAERTPTAELQLSSIELRAAPRTLAPERAPRPLARGSLASHRPRFGDPELPLVKNGTQGRLALLSVARE